MSATQIDNPILVEHADAIRKLGKRVVGDIIEIGRRLTECKNIVGHGNFGPWLDREFPGWSDDTAERFIRVASLANQIPQVAEYDIPVSGLYLLAKPSTPEEARDEIFECAKTGEPVSLESIKETIAEARGSEEHEPPEPDEHKPEPNEQNDSKPRKSEVSVDGKVIVRLSRVQRLEQKNAALQKEVERLTSAGDDFFKREDTATDICRTLAGHLLRLSPSKRKSVLEGLPEMVARLEAEREAESPREPTKRGRKHRRTIEDFQRDVAAKRAEAAS